MTLLAEHPVVPAARANLRVNWRVYAIDGALLGLFMLSACAFGVLIGHPDSPVRRAVESALLRRAMVGLAMGVTAICLIYNPWGRRSGAVMNPAVAVAHWRLGRLGGRDVVTYVAAQLSGGAVGVLVAAALLGGWLRDPAVNFVATVPGPRGVFVAWVAEFSIAMVMISVVMAVNESRRLMPYAGCFAGTLVALYITFEAPLSGMSMNPARTLASAVVGNIWTGWWIYATAPLLGMLTGIEVHRFFGSCGGARCGKFVHDERCFIHCDCADRHLTHLRHA